MNEKTQETFKTNSTFLKPGKLFLRDEQFDFDGQTGRERVVRLQCICDGRTSRLCVAAARISLPTGPAHVLCINSKENLE